MRHYSIFSARWMMVFAGALLVAVAHADTNGEEAAAALPPEIEAIRQAGEAASARIRAEHPAPGKLPLDEPLVFRAGVAEVDITPDEPMLLDGYWSERMSTGVHAPLKVKALVLDDGRTRVALLIADIISYYFQWVEQAKARQTAVAPENVVIAATHTHASPLLLGVFGEVDPGYVDFVGARMAEAITRAAENLQPARIGFAAGELPEEDGEIPGAAQNWHNPGVIDPAVLVMRVETTGGEPMATLVNFGNHPDVLGDETTLVSPDFFWYIYEGVTEELGGATLVFNRALGGVEPIGQGANDIDEAKAIMQRIGGIVTQGVIETAEAIHWHDHPRITVRRTRCEFPVLSPLILQGFAEGMFPIVPEDGVQVNEMALIEVGPAQFLTVPGEPHPEVVFKLVDMMDTPYPFVLSMAEDGVGYMVPEELFNPGGIQELLSTGRDNEFVVLSAARRLLGVDGFVEPEALEGMASRLEILQDDAR